MTHHKLEADKMAHLVANVCYNIASKFVSSSSIALACFIFLLCTLTTSANKSLEEKKFCIGLKNVIKQMVHASAVRSSRYEALRKFGEHSRSQSCSRLRLERLLRIFRALQTFRVLHISNQLLMELPYYLGGKSKVNLKQI